MSLRKLKATLEAKDEKLAQLETVVDLFKEAAMAAKQEIAELKTHLESSLDYKAKYETELNRAIELENELYDLRKEISDLAG